MRTSESSLRADLVGAVTSFLTASYIIVVNPAILSTEGTGIPFSGAMTATVLLCFTCTLLMGLYAKLPYVVAPGMGINAFFTFHLILGKQIPWQQALGIVFWAGIIFLIVSLTPLREKIAKCIPQSIRLGTAAGIGLFLVLIGLKNSSLIVSDPETFGRQAELSKPILASILGFVVLLFLFRKKNPFAFIGSIAVVSGLALSFGWISLPEQILAWPDFSSVFLQLDFWGSLKWAFIPPILTFVFIDLFDSLSTFVGVSQATGLVDEKGEPKNLKQGLVVDAVATAAAGVFGTSSGTAYIESVAGIEAGGRSGRSAVFIALLFLPCLFIGPIAGMIPAYATAPVLIFVGMLMFKVIGDLNYSKIEEFIPPFVIIALIPFSFSITHGIVWGLFSHIFLFWIAGRKKDLSPTLFLICLLCIALLVLENI